MASVERFVAAVLTEFGVPGVYVFFVESQEQVIDSRASQ
jgi:hypothetical protein